MKTGAAKPELPEGVTLIHAKDNVVFVGQGDPETPIEIVTGNAPFPYPSAPAVDKRYMAAVEEQKKKRENRGRIRLVD